MADAPNKNAVAPPPAKKRKRAAPKANKAGPAAVRSSTPSIAIKPPTNVLIIDNGGDTLKYGWLSDSEPRLLSNRTAKLLHQWALLVGDQIDQVQPTQLESVTRSMERSHITNLGNQLQVWKRLLDIMRVHVPMNTEASQAFGWKVAARSSAKSKHEETPIHAPHTLGVLLLLAPHTPRCILEQIYQVWFHDFGFGHVGVACSALFGSRPSPTSTQLVVDMGWSGIHIVPTHPQQTVIPRGVRRLGLGGRHLINLWKYFVSYRQWNMMDSEYLLRDVQHQLAYLSMNLAQDLKVAQQIPNGRRPYDRDFCLPDFVSSFRGEVRLPHALQRLKEMEEQERASASATASSSSSDREKDKKQQETMDETDTGGDSKVKKEQDDEAQHDEDEDNQEDEPAEVDSDEETEQDRRKRLLRQRQEEERRKREEELERQVLQVSVERFTIPEVLFRPSDAGLSSDIAGLHQAIAQAVQACPRHYQAALYSSIRVVGGLSQLPNLKERLERDLQTLVPTQYEMNIEVADTPVQENWFGAQKWIKECSGGGHQKWSINKDEWDGAKKKKSEVWKRLLSSNGGKLI